VYRQHELTILVYVSVAFILSYPYFTVCCMELGFIVRLIKSMRMRWAGHVARMCVRRDVYRVLVGKPEGKRPFWETQA